MKGSSFGFLISILTVIVLIALFMAKMEISKNTHEEFVSNARIGYNMIHQTEFLKRAIDSSVYWDAAYDLSSLMQDGGGYPVWNRAGPSMDVIESKYIEDLESKLSDKKSIPNVLWKNEFELNPTYVCYERDDNDGNSNTRTYDQKWLTAPSGDYKILRFAQDCTSDKCFKKGVGCQLDGDPNEFSNCVCPIFLYGKISLHGKKPFSIYGKLGDDPQVSVSSSGGFNEVMETDFRTVVSKGRELFDGGAWYFNTSKFSGEAKYYCYERDDGIPDTNPDGSQNTAGNINDQKWLTSTSGDYKIKRWVSECSSSVPSCSNLGSGCALEEGKPTHDNGAENTACVCPNKLSTPDTNRCNKDYSSITSTPNPLYSFAQVEDMLKHSFECGRGSELGLYIFETYPSTQSGVQWAVDRVADTFPSATYDIAPTVDIVDSGLNRKFVVRSEVKVSGSSAYPIPKDSGFGPLELKFNSEFEYDGFLSNIPPVLSGGLVELFGGGDAEGPDGTKFRFQVTYRDPEGTQRVGYVEFMDLDGERIEIQKEMASIGPGDNYFTERDFQVVVDFFGDLGYNRGSGTYKHRFIFTDNPDDASLRQTVLTNWMDGPVIT